MTTIASDLTDDYTDSDSQFEYESAHEPWIESGSIGE